MEAIGRKDSTRWHLGEDGSIEIWGYCGARTHESLSVVNPAWLVSAIGHLIVMINHLRRRAGKPGVPYEIDCSFIGNDCRSHWRISPYEVAGRELIREEAIEIGPFVLARETSSRTTFAALERAIWNGLGISIFEPLGFNPEQGVSWLETALARNGAI